MKTNFDPASAARLAERAEAIQASAQELAALGERDPGLAGACGVEVCALEARTILFSGAPARVAKSAAQAAGMGQIASIEISDMQALSRLEAVVSLGSSRIDLKMASMDAEAAQHPTAMLGSALGLASTAFGLFKSFF